MPKAIRMNLQVLNWTRNGTEKAHQILAAPSGAALDSTQINVGAFLWFTFQDSFLYLFYISFSRVPESEKKSLGVFALFCIFPQAVYRQVFLKLVVLFPNSTRVQTIMIFNSKIQQSIHIINNKDNNKDKQSNNSNNSNNVNNP